MNLNFSKKEVLALEVLCSESLSAGEIARKLGAKKSLVSRILRSLGEKGLALFEKKGTKKMIRLSPAAHARAFMRLFGSRPSAKIEEWLSGRAMDVLLALSGKDGVEKMKLVEEESGCSKPTLYKLLKRFYGAGIAAKYGQFIKITDQIALEFVCAYGDGIAAAILDWARAGNVAVRVRKHVLVRTKAVLPEWFCLTGLSLLSQKHGLEASLASYRDYYFNLGEAKREISMEEAFAHALLLSTLPAPQDTLLLAGFYSKNIHKMNAKKLAESVRRYSMQAQFDEIRKAVEYHEKMGAMR